jgi:hypothetical protein
VSQVEQNVKNIHIYTVGSTFPFSHWVWGVVDSVLWLERSNNNHAVQADSSLPRQQNNPIGLGDMGEGWIPKTGCLVTLYHCHELLVWLT